jgi:hypothetical protein
MSIHGASTGTNAKPAPVRRQVDRRILRFSLSIGAVAALFMMFSYVASAFPALQQSKRNNLRALREITCGDEKCDTTLFATNWVSEEPDYLIYTTKRYLIDFPTSRLEDSAHFTPLDYIDTAFIKRFREAASWSTPEDEVWRLYSREVRVGDRSLEILIGYAMKAPWKIIETPQPLIDTVDATLKREADKLATYIQTQKPLALGTRPALSSDGFVIVDANTKRVEVSGPWLPAIMPDEVKLPPSGYQLYVHDGSLYILETDINNKGPLLAASLVTIGSLWWLATLCAVAFAGMSVLARALGRRYLRRYFALLGIQVPTLQEALRIGEGQRVEFKGGLSDHETKTGSVDNELLKSIAAFANTNDGAILIGVDDAGHAKGLDLDLKQRDRLQLKIHQLARNRVKPTPPIQVSFEEIRGMIIARISVARGEAPLYMLDGVVYMRQGSADVQAQPDDLTRLVAEFAF